MFVFLFAFCIFITVLLLVIVPCIISLTLVSNKDVDVKQNTVLFQFRFNCVGTIRAVSHWRELFARTVRANYSREQFARTRIHTDASDQV